MTGWSRAGLDPTPRLAKVEVFPPTCRAPMLRVAATSFQSDPHCLERLRGWVTARLAGNGYDEVLTSVLIAVNELATNTLTHSRSGQEGGSFTVTLTWDHTAVRVVVGDQGGDTLPELKVPDCKSESGRGLLVAAGLADRLGWADTAFGCEVWAEFDKPMDSSKG